MNDTHNEIVDHFVVVKGSPPKSPPKKSAKNASVKEPSNPEHQPSKEYELTNLSRCGSAPVLPLTTASINHHLYKKQSSGKSKKQSRSMRNSTKVALSPLHAPSCPTAEDEILKLPTNLEGKYVYNSAAFMNSIQKVKSEYENTIQILKTRLAQFERDKSEAAKEKHRSLKQFGSLVSEKKVLKNQVDSMSRKIADQKKIILQQEQAFAKLSEKYMSVNEALHNLAGTNGTEAEGNEKGIKGVLRTLSKESQDCHRRLKLLETSNNDYKKKLHQSEKQIEKLTAEVESAKLLALAATTDNTSMVESQHNRKSDHVSMAQPYIDKRLIRVLGKVDSKFSLSNAVELSMRIKQWAELLKSNLVSADPQKIAQSIMALACEVLDCRKAEVYMIDPAEETLTLFADEAGKSSTAVSMAKGIPGHVAKSGKCCIIEDAAKDPRVVQGTAADDVRTKNILCSPIINHMGTVIAVIQARNTKGKRPFSTNDEIMAGIISIQLAALIQSTHISSDLDTLRRRAWSLLLVMPTIASNLIRNADGMIDLKSILEELEKKLCSIAGVNRCKIFIYDENSKSQWYIEKELDSDCNTKTVRRSVKVESGLCGKCLRKKEKVILDDPAAEPEYNDVIDLKSESMGLYVIPIMSIWGDIVGVIEATRKKSITLESQPGIVHQRAEDSLMVETIELFAIQVASILHLSLLYELMHTKQGKRQ